MYEEALDFLLERDKLVNDSPRKYGIHLVIVPTVLVLVYTSTILLVHVPQGGGGMWKLHQHSQFFFQP